MILTILLLYPVWYILQMKKYSSLSFKLYWQSFFCRKLHSITTQTTYEDRKSELFASDGKKAFERREINRQTDRQAGRQTERKKERKKERKTYFLLSKIIYVLFRLDFSFFLPATYLPRTYLPTWGGGEFDLLLYSHFKMYATRTLHWEYMK